MRALKVLPALLALTFAVPAFAKPENTRPAAAQKAGAKRGEKREARLLAALKKNGIEDARAKKIVAIFKKYRVEKKPVHEEARTHRQNLRRLNESPTKDQAAIQKEQDALKAASAKIEKIKERHIAELNTVLKPAERAKVQELMQRGKKHKGDKAAKNAKNKKRAANKKTQRTTG